MSLQPPAPTTTDRPDRRDRPRRERAGRTACAAILALSGVVTSGCAAPAPPRADIRARIGSITAPALERHVRALCALGPRPAGDAGATERTLAHLAATLRAWGYDPVEEVFEDRVTVTSVLRAGAPEDDGRILGTVQRTEPRTLRNLIAERRGLTRPDLVVELGAHYDTVAVSVGADDNASGVALLLEVARVLAEAPVNRTVRFCFFAAEEDGLLGSAEHVRRRPPMYDGILDGALVADMVGFASDEPGSQGFPVRIPLLLDPPGTADFLLLLGDWDSAPLADHMARAAARYAPGLRTWGILRLAGLGGEGGRSDHDAYWEAGERAILLNDTANWRSPHYHAPSDTPDTLDYEFLSDVARAACAWTLERADLPAGPAMIATP